MCVHLPRRNQHVDTHTGQSHEDRGTGDRDGQGTETDRRTDGQTDRRTGEGDGQTEDRGTGEGDGQADRAD